MQLCMFSPVRHGGLSVAGVCLAALLATTAQAADRIDVKIPSLTNGQPLNGALFTPDGNEPRPAVIVLAPGDGRPEQADYQYASALAKNGFVALAVSYQVNRTNNSRWSPRITSDLVGVVNWLRARPEVENRPVGTVGFSAGSQGLLLGAKSKFVKAMVVYYGGYNLRKYAKAGQKIPASLPLPINAAAEVSGAVLLLHGDKDDEISVNDAVEMRDALKAADKTVELVVYPDTYHRFERGNVQGRDGDISPAGFTYKRNQQAAQDAFQRTLAWLEKYLPKESSPDTPLSQGGGKPDDDRANAEPVGPTGRTPSQIISGSDSDGDGKLSKSEFKGAPSAFSKIDADKDGFLTKQELISAWQ